ncbi:tetraspanin-15-like isoform X2 [Ahaetulla prasina]|uniref:tetraspanin-15-like isoform X2 n=1 Tax=Ahaetulla prasina TaxID=499056 RepID=UPI0026484C3D|nr:tetraspanin-15-like isoform X2 [Ahaetulla prasina]
MQPKPRRPIAPSTAQILPGSGTLPAKPGPVFGQTVPLSRAKPGRRLFRDPSLLLRLKRPLARVWGLWRRSLCLGFHGTRSACTEGRWAAAPETGKQAEPSAPRGFVRVALFPAQPLRAERQPPLLSDRAWGSPPLSSPSLSERKWTKPPEKEKAPRPAATADAAASQRRCPAGLPGSGDGGAASRRPCGAMGGSGPAWRDSLPYYYCVKFSLSASSTLFSMVGLVIFCVGIYAEVERQKHRTLEGLFLAPAVILILLGLTIFAVSFIGMVGSLRDNRTLLKTMNAVFHSSIQDGIRHYYDDLDFKNILDYVQQKFSCCGGDEFSDWHVNPYHSCNGSGPLACGVPYTCCIRKAPGEVINTLCGYRTLNQERLELVNTIHVRGCIHAVSFWFKDNFEATLAIVCSLLLPQVFGLVMAWLHWQKLNEIHSQMDTVDFKQLDWSDFNFATLDLTGAGWCWCLPREGGYIPVCDKDDESEVEAATSHSKV